jgi:pSer/pThr/pTyr-binding forkhead associated (FHA) protein
MAVQFQFVMRSGPTPGATYSLEGDQIIIGRDSTNGGVVINDSEISRKHARLTFQGGKYVLEDLGSTNGTFVNGQRLAGPAVLRSGDVVSLGEQIVLMFDVLSADAGATVVAARKSVPAPVMSAPVMPAQAQVAAPSPSNNYSTPVTPAKRNAAIPILIGVGVVLVICLCVGLLLYQFAPTSFWSSLCGFLPFLTWCS